MDYYYANKNAQSSGEHEVHKSSCSYLPDADNQMGLGYFSTSAEAIQKAKEYYSKVDGCHYCCPACHRR